MYREVLSRRTFVVYLHPGEHFPSEGQITGVEGRNPEREAKTAPTGSIGFYYFDEVVVAERTAGDEHIRNLRRSDISRVFFIDATPMTFREAINMKGDQEQQLNLINFMRGHAVKSALVLRTGDFAVYSPESVGLVYTDSAN